MNGGSFKPRRRRMGIHFRLGPDEPGFIIGGIHCRLLHRQHATLTPYSFQDRKSEGNGKKQREGEQKGG